MQYELLKYLKCPITKTELRFELISEFEKPYHNKIIKEIKSGLLFSKTGFVFPIIGGIPRMLIESIYDYSGFLEKNLTGFQVIKSNVEQNYKGLLQYCVDKNKKSER